LCDGQLFRATSHTARGIGLQVDTALLGKTSDNQSPIDHDWTTMKSRIVSVAMIAIAISLSASSIAANGGGGGNGGSHGGGSGAGGPQSRGVENKPSDNDQSAKTSKTFSNHLAEDKNLSSKLASLLPADTNLQDASAGFKNLGQFVAAVHVSKNLGIPFTDLKAKMMDGQSIGMAVKFLSLKSDADTEAKRAQKQAESDLEEKKL
jgi:hypothetical protein